MTDTVLFSEFIRMSPKQRQLKYSKYKYVHLGTLCLVFYSELEKIPDHHKKSCYLVNINGEFEQVAS